MENTVKLGSRVYLRNAICGEPGFVAGYDKHGRVLVEWVDIPEMGRLTAHEPDSLIVDQAFKCKQFCLDFDKMAA